MQTFKLTFYTLFFASLLMTSCKNNKKETLSYKDVQIMAEGPLFEGSNTIQGDLVTQLPALTQKLKIDTEDIVSIRLNSVNLSIDDTSNFNLFSSITLQFASEKTDMIEVALINPVPVDKQTIQLTVASEQENLLDLLKQDKFTIVADAILKEDSDKNINMKAHLDFELTYKK